MYISTDGLYTLKVRAKSTNPYYLDSAFASEAYDTGSTLTLKAAMALSQSGDTPNYSIYKIGADVYYSTNKICASGEADASGNIVIEGLSAGTYKVVISRPGCTSVILNSVEILTLTAKDLSSETYMLYPGAFYGSSDGVGPLSLSLLLKLLLADSTSAKVTMRAAASNEVFLRGKLAHLSDNEYNALSDEAKLLALDDVTQTEFNLCRFLHNDVDAIQSKTMAEMLSFLGRKDSEF